MASLIIPIKHLKIIAKIFKLLQAEEEGTLPSPLQKEQYYPYTKDRQRYYK